MPSIAKTSLQYKPIAMQRLFLHTLCKLWRCCPLYIISLGKSKSHIGCLKSLLRQIAGIMPASTIRHTLAIVQGIHIGMTYTMYSWHVAATTLTINEVENTPLRIDKCQRRYSERTCGSTFTLQYVCAFLTKRAKIGYTESAYCCVQDLDLAFIHTLACGCVYQTETLGGKTKYRCL